VCVCVWVRGYGGVCVRVCVVGVWVWVCVSECVCVWVRGYGGVCVFFNRFILACSITKYVILHASLYICLTFSL